jgi:DNA-binding NtrC family response regulator
MKQTQNTLIYILEDDEWYANMLEYYLLLNPDNIVKKFFTAKDLLTQIHNKPDVITLDYSLGDANGNEVLKKIKEFDADIEVIIVSGQDDINTAVKLIKEGAFDYIVKNDETKERLWSVLTHLSKIKQLKKQVEVLKKEIKKNYDFSKVIIGQSDAIKKIYQLIEKASETNITVSVTGETGTGKEVVAKAIHYNSARQKQPFVAINVAAIPKELLESELFGHEEGAFTGAAEKRIGRFEEADKGTLFLDEIGELEISLQAKLLRVLQEKQINRVGGNTVIPIDVRIIVATHKNLLQEVENKTFREDLYYRLLGLNIHLPPLRERGKDVLILANHFIKLFTEENNMQPKQLSENAQEKLLSYPFPGNIRELKSIIELAVVLSNDIIEENDLQINSNATLNALLNYEITLKEFNLRVVQHFLNKYDNDVVLVAKKLDIGKSTIYNLIKEHKISIS